MTVEEANRLLAEADVVLSEQEVTAVIGRMANDISARLGMLQPIVMCVMNGGLVFAGQLLTKLRFPLEVDYVHATRYGYETTGFELTWLVRPRTELRDRAVLLLDDIIDEGVTLATIADYCYQEGAKEVVTAVLIDKRHERKLFPELRADFAGIETGDRFLFGYGLDYKGYWRNAPGIYAVKGL